MKTTKNLYIPPNKRKNNQLKKTELADYLVGTSTSLEKPYFRLTSAPNPANIRPEHILKKALPLLLEKFNDNQVSYEYTNNQLKAIRQDITVQKIENEFALSVYQQHSKIALENDDIMEFNCTLVMVLQFYKKRFYTSLNEKNLYLELKILHSAIYENSNAICDILVNYKDILNNKIILKFLSALQTKNFYQIFQIYSNLNTLSKKIVNLKLDSFRKMFLRRMIKAYKPMNLEIIFINNCMAFQDVDSCIKFLEQVDFIVFSEGYDLILTKESFSKM